MRSAREDVLQRIRAALSDVAGTGLPDNTALHRRYRQHSEAPVTKVADLFAERVAEYQATVMRGSRDRLTEAIERALAQRGLRRLLVPTDLPTEWLPAEIESRRDEDLSTDELAACDGVLTGCALGIAQTGTIVLDGGTRQGRRAVTLIPDYHLCVVYVEQVVELVPEAMSRLAPAAIAGAPITLISGPSATSDIELNRVEGVHGPRTLDVLLIR